MKIQLLLLTTVLFVTPIQAGIECTNLPQVLELFLDNHYIHKKVTSEIKEHTAEQYLKHLDPSKTMLLESDVPKIKESLTDVFEGSKSAKCESLFEAQKTITERARENEEFVKSFLGKNYKMDETTELTIDPKKRGYPKTKEEREDTLKKMIHFQIQNLLLAKMKTEQAQKQLIHRYELVTKRFKEKKASDLMSSFADSFAESLDPHSSFLSQDSLEDFQISMQLSLEGIGASLSNQDGFTVIEELIKGGSADRAKVLKPKDKIIAVNQESGDAVSVIDMELRDVVKLIRGKKGTKVTLTILRQSENTETFETTIVRDKIDLTDQAAKITYEKRVLGGKNYKFGIIDLPSFYGTGGKQGRSCSGDVKTLLQAAKKENIDGLVLNLSRNGGGLLDEAVKITGLFINTGNVVATKNSQGRVQTLADEDSGTEYNGPLVVVTSRVSASASEILAGALKDYRRAVIVGGDHTFGKGSVQSLSDLPFRLGGMKVTMALFFVPGGKSTQHGGVSADIVFPSVFTNDDIGEKTLDYSLPPQSIPNFISLSANTNDPKIHWEPITDSKVKVLSQKSSDRIAKDPKFTEVKKRIEKIAKNSGVIKLSELKTEALKKSAKNIEKKKKSPEPTAEPEDKDAEDEKIPFLQESTNILLDLVTLKP